MGNLSSNLSDEYSASTIIRAGLAGTFMITILIVLAVGLCLGWWKTKVVVEEEPLLDEDDLNKKIGEEQKKGTFRRVYDDISTKGFMWLLFFTVAAATTIKAVLMISTPSDLFQLRIGESIPPLFDRCNEGLVDQGICAMSINAGLYVPIFIVHELAHANYMKWTIEAKGAHVILTTIYRSFIFTYVIYGLYTASWVMFGFATVAALCDVALLIFSSVDSLFFKKEPVKNKNGYSTQRRKGGFLSG